MSLKSELVVHCVNEMVLTINPMNCCDECVLLKIIIIFGIYYIKLMSSVKSSCHVRFKIPLSCFMFVQHNDSSNMQKPLWMVLYVKVRLGGFARAAGQVGH